MMKMIALKKQQAKEAMEKLAKEKAEAEAKSKA